MAGFATIAIAATSLPVWLRNGVLPHDSDGCFSGKLHSSIRHSDRCWRSRCFRGLQRHPTADDAGEVARRAALEQSTTLTVTPEELKRQLNCWQANFVMQGNDIKEASLYQSGIRSIAPLKGLPLIALDLGMTQVADLAPLAGMQLERLDLENTPVSDISLLRGMPLTVLKLQNTKVTDFAPLEGLPLKQLNLLGLPFLDSHMALIQNAPLETLWLAGTQVSDLSSLPLKSLESLDIARTGVSSLAAAQHRCSFAAIEHC
ncbi:MAG UNVERIFIED_CONTAM: hypothetical protein LVR18_48915 [Planctomycetaceae bacterium]|jgi:Leucine-rich repeat (LRR) protein